VDRAERTGLGIAIVGHAALFAALSLAMLDPPKPLEPLNKPLDVVLVEEAALESTAPEIAKSAAPPAPEPSPAAEAAPAAAPAPPAPISPPTPPRLEPKPEPKPVPRPEPKPTPKPEPKPVPKPKLTPKPAPKPKPVPPKAAAKPTPAKPTPAKTVAKPAQAKPSPAKPTSAKPKPGATQTAANTSIRPTNRLNGLNLGTGGAGTSTAPKTGGSAAPKGTGSGNSGAAPKGAPAQKTAAEVRTTIDVRIDGAIAPFWKRNIPTGVDVEQLVTVIEIRLNKDGSVADTRLKSQSGKTESNQPQQSLHVERAMKSVRQAGPFNLPQEYYDQWKVWEVTFRGRGRL
jgi:outer membrane biosynthesis protein TonB